jgi:hypothetical protein
LKISKPRSISCKCGCYNNTINLPIPTPFSSTQNIDEPEPTFRVQSPAVVVPIPTFSKINSPPSEVTPPKAYQPL